MPSLERVENKLQTMIEGAKRDAHNAATAEELSGFDGLRSIERGEADGRVSGLELALSLVIAQLEREKD